MAKVGILGGTFDPIHLAHLAMAECAAEQYRLEKVLFMPSKYPPHKMDRRLASEQARCEMVRLAIAGREKFAFSDFECRRERVSYTADTLRLLRKEYPEDTFYFIVGGDSLFQMESWYRPEEIFSEAVILAASRDGASVSEMRKQADRLENKFGGRIFIVEMPRMNISSSMIRRKIEAEEPAAGYLPAEVWRYIQENHCYGKGKTDDRVD